MATYERLDATEQKIIRVIQSCKTVEQLGIALRLLQNYMKQLEISCDRETVNNTAAILYDSIDLKAKELTYP
jgi:hypothetical protein